MARLAPSRHLRTVTCTSYPCAYIRVRYPIPLFIPQHHIPHPFHPVLAPVKRTPVNPVISRKLPPPSSLSLSLHSFPSPLPPFPFFYSCLLHATTRVHDRPTTTTTRTRTTMRIPRVCTRSYPDIWPSHFQVFPPWQEREVVPLILNCNVRFTSSGTVSFYNLNLFFFSKNREGARTKSWIRTLPLALPFSQSRSKMRVRGKLQDSKGTRFSSTDLETCVHVYVHTVNEAGGGRIYRDLNWKAPLRDLSP